MMSEASGPVGETKYRKEYQNKKLGFASKYRKMYLLEELNFGLAGQPRGFWQRQAPY